MSHQTTAAADELDALLHLAQRELVFLHDRFALLAFEGAPPALSALVESLASANLAVARLRPLADAFTNPGDDAVLRAIAVAEDQK